MFVHETFESATLAGMIHYRMGKTPGGLAFTTELARSGTLASAVDLVRPSGLMVAPPEHLEMPSAPKERIECADEHELVVKGVNTWKRMIEGFDSQVVGLVGVHLILNQTFKKAETTRPSGLVVVTETPDTTPEFESYVALPSEITALERMAQQVNELLHVVDRTVPGHYL